MKFVLMIPKNCAAVSLLHVAGAMADGIATAGGSRPVQDSADQAAYKATYDGVFPRLVSAIVNDARAGRLRVADEFGISSTYDGIIQKAQEEGSLSEFCRYDSEPDWERLQTEIPALALGAWDFSGVDLGPSTVDIALTHAAVLHTTFPALTDWGAACGHEFFLSDDWVPWVDERGIVLAPGAESESPPQASSAGVDEAAKVSDPHAEVSTTQQEAGTGSPCAAVTKLMIIQHFCVFADGDKNWKWWTEKMRDAKRNPSLLECRYGSANLGSGGSFWFPSRIAGWLVDRQAKHLTGMDADRARAALKKFPGCSEVADDLFPHSSS